MKRATLVWAGSVLAIMLGPGMGLAAVCPGNQAHLVTVEDGVTREQCGSLPSLLANTKARPAYPPRAVWKRVSGSAILQGIVDAQGRVVDLEVLQERPDDVGFGKAAMEAVRTWQYRPATVEGKPIGTVFAVKVDFDLGEDGKRPTPGPIDDIGQYLQELESSPTREAELILSVGSTPTLRVRRPFRSAFPP
jgi:TonB family protein